jgi:GT2 family glycosyltransferase
MITASIVIYNSPVPELLKLVFSILDVEDAMLFIVDNSPDDSIRHQLPESDKITYIFNKRNLGFGAAHNIAIGRAIQLGSKYHLVVNPDIYFDSGTIETIIGFMDSNPDAGLIMPQILYPNGEIQYLPKLLPSPLSIIKRKLLLPKSLFIKLNSAYELRFVPVSLMLEAPIISGCFSFFRTEVFKKVGYYDERFFMYFEDFDISRRICKMYKTLYYPKVFVFHGYERGAQKSIRLFRIYFISFIKYFNKWGWFFDKERNEINKLTLELVKGNLK